MASKEPEGKDRWETAQIRERPHVYFSFQKEYKARAGAEKDRARVQLLTDPWSVWCWGFEPIRRTIELRYPTIEFQYLLGGMFPQLPSPEELPFSVERFFGQVHRATGMPIGLDAVQKDRPKSTFPACVHVHAVRRINPEVEGPYLRALREAVYLDGLNVSRPEVALEVAERVGIDGAAFKKELASGEAKKDFEAKMGELTARNLYAYPTLLVAAGERTARVEGFQSLPAVLGIVEAVSGKVHPPLPDPPLEAIISKGERVATREVAEVLGIGMERAYDLLTQAKDGGDLERERHSNGDVWRHAGRGRA